MNSKQLFFLCFFLFSTIIVFCQRFNGGLLAGVAATEISGDRLEGPNKAGVYAGGFVNTSFTDRSSVQMELDFIQKGSRQNPDSTSIESYLLKLNYVELALHYRWDFGKIFSLEAGPSLGLLINQPPHEEADGQVIDGRDSQFQTPDLSLNIGLFVSLTQYWRFNIRYSNSILAVRPHASGQTYKWNKGQYNEVLSFTFHYQL